MSAAWDLCVTTLTEALGSAISRPVDASDPRHQTLLEAMSKDCPERDAALRRTGRGQPGRRPSWLD
jgi:hypothetical protein